MIGPILFSMVMESLEPVSNNTIFIKYADDLTALHFIRTGLQDKPQAEVDSIESWSSRHNLKINLSKTCSMDIVTKKNLNCDPVFLSNSPLLDVKHVKILGCLFASDLKWNLFVESIVKRASQRIYLILCLKRSDCPPDLLFRAYCSYIRPILLYAFPVVCNMSQYLKEKLFRVEKRVLRIINHSDFTKVTLFSSGDKICENLFSRVVNEPLHPLREFFNPRSVSLRNKCCLKRPRAKTKRFRDSFIKYCP